MKIISLKALSRLLLATCLAFTTHFTLADSKPAIEASVEQGVVHLNNSTAEQFLTLKGIGQKKAAAIVAYRKEVGPFKSVNDLLKVKGIGKKVIMDNKNRLVI